MFRIILAIAITVFSSSSCLASSLPSFSIDSYCQAVSEAGGGSYQIEEKCREMENDSMRNLESMEAPNRVMKYCTEVAQAGGGSYQILETCINMELESKSNIGQ